MERESIDPGARIGAVALRVQSLQRSTEFYTSQLGFQLISQQGPVALLGAGETHLLTLREETLTRSRVRTAGLYHFAILVPSRTDLATSLRHLVLNQTPLQGFADHLVSEAIYLADPDGNGIEIYRDRPPEQWPYRDGQLLMATDPLDVNSLLDEAGANGGQWAGLAPGTRIGHIHLQVPNLGDATAFYEKTLGFDLILRYGPSATFLSAGGYHHHVGLNTWAGTGLPLASADAPGLIWYTIDLPDHDKYERSVRRLKAQLTSTQEREDGLLILDPAGVNVLLRSRS